MFLYSTVSTLKPAETCQHEHVTLSESKKQPHSEHFESKEDVIRLPMVGMVVTISPSLSLYRIVVFPAASRPTMRILISFFPHSRSKIFENDRPILAK